MTPPRLPRSPSGRRLPAAALAAATLAGSCTLLALPADAATLFTSRIGAGLSTPLTVPSGATYTADRGAVGGGDVAHVDDVPIDGTTDDVIYQRHRWGLTGYTVAVPCTAVYDVTLSYAETVFTTAGRRVFDVSVEEGPPTRTDVIAAVGANTALDRTSRVVVSDRQVDVDFRAVAEDPMFSAIQVQQVSACGATTPAPVPTSPVPSPTRPTTVPTPPTPPTTDTAVARMSVGSSSSYTDSAGKVWSPDSTFVGGETWGPASVPIAGTVDDALFQKNRWGMSAYRVPVPGNGTYRVELRFAEVVFDEAGRRVFDVSAEGEPVLSRFDVVAEGGHATAVTRTFDVPVSDGVLDLGFGRITDDPMLSGLTVTAVGTSTPSPTTSPTPAPTISPTPPPTTGPIRPPAPQTGYPNASNTGVPAGTVLTPSGSLSISTSGTVIDGHDVNGSI
ncbi:MAG: uncharacterized protein JWN88_2384, partial [Frankiales bacterium]|nr:uncharacterized protein [Frankiales bacterium]